MYLRNFATNAQLLGPPTTFGPLGANHRSESKSVILAGWVEQKTAVLTAHEMAAALLRAAGHATRSSALRSILARHGALSTGSSEPVPIVVTLYPAPEADDDDDQCRGEEDEDLRSRLFRLSLAKRSATVVLEKWAGEGRAAPAPELRCIARDLSRARRYKHALEVPLPSEP
jgi:hypothetical protein